MSNSNERFTKVATVWAGYQLAHDVKHVPKLVFSDEKVARKRLRAGKKGERVIMKVGFVGCEMSNNDAAIEPLLGQIRQQLTNNPYKQQCEDLANEVLSLKSQLRDASALVAELQKEITTLNGELRHESEQVKAYQSDVLRYQNQVEDLESRRDELPVRSCCRKEDVQECEHDWVEFHGLFIAEGDPRNEPGYSFCSKCGLKDYNRKCEHEWSMVLGDGPSFYECEVCGAQSKDLPYDLRWLAL